MPILSSSKIEEELIAAQNKAELLFQQIEERGLVRTGISEKELNDQVNQLASELLGIKKYWHKRIVRAGANTLCPYRENPPNLTIHEGDTVFFDFGPIFEQWEADFGKTYLLGKDPEKQKMIADLETIFQESKRHFEENEEINGSEFYNFIVNRCAQHGWVYGGPHAGHLIGEFPHERELGENSTNYICAENVTRMRAPDIKGNKRYWILEIHLVNPEKTYGAFFEDLLNINRK
jgi:Xaa-Pro aminopeptidase